MIPKQAPHPGMWALYDAKQLHDGPVRRVQGRLRLACRGKQSLLAGDPLRVDDAERCAIEREGDELASWMSSDSSADHIL